MLIKSTPIIDFKDLANIDNLANVIGIHIDFKLLKSSEVIQTLLKIDFPFFLSINLNLSNSTDIKDELNSLVSITFNLNYYKKYKTPLLVLFGNEENSDIKSTIKNAFLQQGYSSLNLYQIIKGENSLSHKFDNLYITNNNYKEKLDEFYSCFSENSIDKKLFVKTELCDQEAIFKSVDKTELLFSQTNKKLYSIYQNIQQLKKSNISLNEANKHLSIQVENFKTNQTLLREDATNIIDWYKGELDKVKNWYNKEYEVLPNWYKKTGHILKRLKNN